MSDQVVINQGLNLLLLKPEIIETLSWMIKHFDYERQIMEWGEESKELKSAKELLENIENI